MAVGVEDIEESIINGFPAEVPIRWVKVALGDHAATYYPVVSLMFADIEMALDPFPIREEARILFEDLFPEIKFMLGLDQRFVISPFHTVLIRSDCVARPGGWGIAEQFNQLRDSGTRLPV